jgi:3-phenylpropionate/trans-cinnamate dioxygenase ferredoxin reductase subunit
MHGGEASEPGVIHACQSRIISDATIEVRRSTTRTVDGVLSALRPLSSEVMEVGIRTERALPFLPGQYAQFRFSGYPSRPFSLTHPLQGAHERGTIWLHVRRIDDGRVTPALGKRIKVGHRVAVSGPFGSAYFRPNLDNRLILVSTGTGFSPVWSIMAAALHENPKRKIMLIAGARSLDTLYMGPVLGKLARFPNVLVLPVCSTPQSTTQVVKLGRPTDFIPRLHATDIV